MSGGLPSLVLVYVWGMMVGAGWLSTVSFIILVSQGLPLSTSGGVNQNLTPSSWKLRRAAACLPGACAEGIDHGNVYALGRNSGTGWYVLHTLRPLRLRGGGDKSRYYKLLGLEQGTDDQVCTCNSQRLCPCAVQAGINYYGEVFYGVLHHSVPLSPVSLFDIVWGGLHKMVSSRLCLIPRTSGSNQEGLQEDGTQVAPRPPSE